MKRRGGRVRASTQGTEPPASQSRPASMRGPPLERPRDHRRPAPLTTSTAAVSSRRESPAAQRCSPRSRTTGASRTARIPRAPTSGQSTLAAPPREGATKRRSRPARPRTLAAARSTAPNTGSPERSGRAHLAHPCGRRIDAWARIPRTAIPSSPVSSRVGPPAINRRPAPRAPLTRAHSRVKPMRALSWWTDARSIAPHCMKRGVPQPLADRGGRARCRRARAV